MRCAWILTLAVLLAACGDEEQPPPETPGLTVPSTPEAALAWVREAASDDAALRRRLAAWPMDVEGFAESEETRVVLPGRLRMALQDGDVETALRRQHMLEDLFGGEGLTPEGRALPADVIIGSIFDEALLAARKRIDGGKPDIAGSKRALDIARGTAPEDDAESESRIRETRTWVELGHIRELTEPLRLSRPIETGPRIVVLADDFALGEAVFIGVLERWQRDASEGGVALELVPVITGQVRIGIRRVPAESTEAELASIRKRAKTAGIAVTATVPEGVAATALAAIGLGPQATVLLVVNADGAIIARDSGKNLDPRDLDPVIERLISR